MHGRTSAPVQLLFLLALSACGGGDSSLSGSIGQTHSLAFDAVSFRQLGGSYSVVYIKGAPPSAQTILRLVYTPAAGAVPPPDKTVNLTFGNGGNAALSRATPDSLSFPAASSGTLTLSTDLSATAAIADGDTVRGRFGVLFASGQALAGTFAAPYSRSPIQ